MAGDLEVSRKFYHLEAFRLHPDMQNPGLTALNSASRTDLSQALYSTIRPSGSICLQPQDRVARLLGFQDKASCWLLGPWAMGRGIFESLPQSSWLLAGSLGAPG